MCVDCFGKLNLAVSFGAEALSESRENSEATIREGKTTEKLKNNRQLNKV